MKRRYPIKSATLATESASTKIEYESVRVEPDREDLRAGDSQISACLIESLGCFLDCLMIVCQVGIRSAGRDRNQFLSLTTISHFL